MSLGEVSPGTAMRIAWKEMQTGLLLGATLGVAMGAFIYFLLPMLQAQTDVTYARLALAVSASLLIQVFSSTLLGALLPIGARSIRLDPAVVSSPSLASTVDVTGMLIYFSAAKFILSL
jgi:magnesium transporter